MSGSARADIETHIDWLEKRLVRLDEELERLIADNPVWKDLSALLCSVPGVGPVVSATLIANLPELGSLSHAPLTPLAWLSGLCLRSSIGMPRAAVGVPLRTLG
jgi:transposase